MHGSCQVVMEPEFHCPMANDACARRMFGFIILPPVRCDRGVPMNFANTKDESLLTFYESVRRQVEADRHEKYRFTGNSAKEYAERLREEMDRRKLRFKPIDWPL